MSKLAILDPTKTGRQAESLERQLHHLIVGQEEAIHQIVRAYQTHVAGLLRPAARSQIFCSWGRRAPEKLASSRQPPSPCWRTLVQ